ncbi:NTP transferase domain-containing protein [Flavobacterium sp. IMCC34518]|uniref:nucleotidyltransferase family protein n=1 Tax=Flavobacterium sp. IMCC34518 TaxID=3003623 RepID=UPI0022ABD6CF|nr:NTP transferase domain-containing protein [Flavobacterium sp. IMCC34518]
MENNTVFVLLAGGKSERMGMAKGLLLYKENFWILEQLNRISASTITDVFIGLGHNYEEYLNKIPSFSEAKSHFVLYKNLKIRVVINKKPEQGSFSTLQTVLQQIPKNKSVLISPIDVPILNSNELQNIIEAQNQIVLPNFEHKNGHPIKLHSDFWNPLLLLNPTDQNSRLDLEIKKINPFKITRIAVIDSCILKNLNTPNDWIEFTNSNQKLP